MHINQTFTGVKPLPYLNEVLSLPTAESLELKALRVENTNCGAIMKGACD